MHARVTRFQVSPDRLDEVNDYFQETVLPRARPLRGFKGAVALADRESGNVFSFTLWESEDVMQASENAAEGIRGQASTDLGFTPTVERYEVAAFEVV
ncbi:MAG: antibiotic biosynthesis monooxygenase [Actinomycetota bacterium]|nr:antibiotic biosynthesis monooxygenase [Actinomycetota bacterium]